MFGKVKRAVRAAIPNSVCSVSYKCVPQNDWGRLEEALTSPTQCELGKCMTLFVQIYKFKLTHCTNSIISRQRKMKKKKEEELEAL